MGIVGFIGLVSNVSNVHAADVEINKTNFPCSEFRKQIKIYDNNSNGKLSNDEISKIKKFNVYFYEKKPSIKGIEFLKDLEDVFIAYNGPENNKKFNLKSNTKLKSIRVFNFTKNITEFDISGCKELKILEISPRYDNKSKKASVKKLDLSANEKLEELYIGGCKIKSIDLQNNVELKKIKIFNNKIDKLDVSKNIKLEYINCRKNPIGELNLDSNENLSSLYADECKIKKISLSNNKKIKRISLNASLDKSIKELDLSNSNNIKILYCNDNNLDKILINSPALKILECSNNNIKYLDLDVSTKLKRVYAKGNLLENVNTEKFGDLTKCDLSRNQLDKIDLSKNTYLKKLDLSDNKLTNVDITGLSALEYLDLSFNQLDKIDLSKNIHLKELDLSVNKLTSINLTGITDINKLHIANNKIKNINLRKQTDLCDLDVSNNELIKLDLSKNSELLEVSCENNKFKYLEKNSYYGERRYFKSIKYTTICAYKLKKDHTFELVKCFDVDLGIDKVKVNGKKIKVTSVGTEVDWSAEKVVIGKYVKKIKKCVLTDASDLKTIVIKSKKLKKVDKDAFYGCKKNVVIKVPKKCIKKYKKLLKKVFNFKYAKIVKL